MAVVKIKTFESDVLSPLPIPDGTSLEEKVNTFLATLAPKDVLDTIQISFASAKYGVRKTYVGTTVYLQ